MFPNDGLKYGYLSDEPDTSSDALFEIIGKPLFYKGNVCTTSIFDPREFLYRLGDCAEFSLVDGEVLDSFSSMLFNCHLDECFDSRDFKNHEDQELFAFRIQEVLSKVLCTYVSCKYGLLTKQNNTGFKYGTPDVAREYKGGSFVFSPALSLYTSIKGSGISYNDDVTVRYCYGYNTIIVRVLEYASVAIIFTDDFSDLMVATIKGTDELRYFSMLVSPKGLIDRFDAAMIRLNERVSAYKEQEFAQSDKTQKISNDSSNTGSYYQNVMKSTKGLSSKSGFNVVVDKFEKLDAILNQNDSKELKSIFDIVVDFIAGNSSTFPRNMWFDYLERALVNHDMTLRNFSNATMYMKTFIVAPEDSRFSGTVVSFMVGFNRNMSRYIAIAGHDDFDFVSVQV